MPQPCEGPECRRIGLHRRWLAGVWPAQSVLLCPACSWLELDAGRVVRVAPAAGFASTASASPPSASPAEALRGSAPAEPSAFVGDRLAPPSPLDADAARSSAAQPGAAKGSALPSQPDQESVVKSTTGCTVFRCPDRAVARGLCASHYNSARRWLRQNRPGDRSPEAWVLAIAVQQGRIADLAAVIEANQAKARLARLLGRDGTLDELLTDLESAVDAARGSLGLAALTPVGRLLAAAASAHSYAQRASDEAAVLHQFLASRGVPPGPEGLAILIERHRIELAAAKAGR